MTNPLTMSEVLKALKDRGIKIASSTFRKYVALGLVKGERIEGRGNVLYFPADTPDRIVQIQNQSKGLNVPLEKIVFTIGDKFDSNGLVSVTPQLLFSALLGILAEMNISLDQELEREDVQKIATKFRAVLKNLGVKFNR